MTKKIGYNDDEIFLLSSEEYEKYRDNITQLNCCWWLRSPGDNQYKVLSIYSDGTIYNIGDYIDYSTGCIRPALKYKNLKSKIAKSVKGDDYFVFGETVWKIIDHENEIAIANLPIGFEPFGEESNDYQNSHIRHWLLNWLGGQKND